jgi:dehydrogenase/reductase SDR family protein 1
MLGLHTGAEGTRFKRMESSSLAGRVAIVTGASRGIGKGIALELGVAGATVYVTGRTLDDSRSLVPGTITETANEVTRLGGRGIAVRCDHSRDDEIQALIQRVHAEQGRIDILVNNAFTLPDGPIFEGRFWEHPVGLWDTLLHVGCRGHYVASHAVAPIMVEQGEGLIVNISSFAGAAYIFNVAYGVGKAAVDRMAKDMAVELQPCGVTCVSLWPGVVRTEYIMKSHAEGKVPFAVENGESPRFTGRAVVALASDPKRLEKTGRVHICYELASEYGFSDIDGRQPPPLAQQMGLAPAS